MRNYLKRLKAHPGVPVATVLSAAFPLAAQAQEAAPRDILHDCALRAALEEAEAALEVATSRLSARSANYPVHVTSEARALEIVRKALGKSHADHFRDATKMMLPTAQNPDDALSAAPDLLDALRKIAAWPNGGNRYGQENIKRFAQAAIDAAIAAQAKHGGAA